MGEEDECETEEDAGEMDGIGCFGLPWGVVEEVEGEGALKVGASVGTEGGDDEENPDDKEEGNFFLGEDVSAFGTAVEGNEGDCDEDDNGDEANDLYGLQGDNPTNA